MKKILICFLFFLNLNAVAKDATGEVLSSTASGAATGMAVGAASDTVKKAALKNIPGLEGLSNTIGEFMSAPTGIMIVSGIGGYNSYTLMQAASDQADECDQNIQKIDNLLKSFKDSWAGLCPNGRENLNEPDCYCYLESGGTNPNRTNSDTCQKLWAQRNYQLTASGSDYKTNVARPDPVGCIASDGTFDQNCTCKRTVDSKGNNTCQKISNLNVPTNSIGMAYIKSSGTAKLIDTVNQLAQGNIGVSNLNGRSLALGYGKIFDLNKGVTKQLFDKSPKNAFRGFNSNEEVLKAQNSLFPPKTMTAIGSALNSNAMASIGATPPSPELSKAIKDVAKKSGLELNGSGGGLANKKVQANNGLNLNFGDQQAQNGNSNVDFGNKTYKMNKNSDINKDNGASIFEIISNRYIQTGVNRLFDESK